MFTRAMFQTPDGAGRAAQRSRGFGGPTTLTETLTPINAANMRAAQAKSESGRIIGKVAIAGWE